VAFGVRKGKRAIRTKSTFSLKGKRTKNCGRGQREGGWECLSGGRNALGTMACLPGRKVEHLVEGQEVLEFGDTHTVTRR